MHRVFKYRSRDLLLKMNVHVAVDKVELIVASVVVTLFHTSSPVKPHMGKVDAKWPLIPYMYQ